MSRNARGKKKGKFWEREYAKPGHFSLSNYPSEDLGKFTRWIERRFGHRLLNPLARVLDLGCGNGRNLRTLAENFRMQGLGYDTAREAIVNAKEYATAGLSYEVRTIAPPLPLTDGSFSFVLDMMASQVLNTAQRQLLRQEEARVLRPGGWLFLKVFLLDEDLNAARMLRDYPTDESGTYLHPEIKVREHVYTEEEITAELEPYFIVHRIAKSHGHLNRGRAHKRRSMCIYAEKKEV
ncbi:MAG: class I SAM-dependent methyltransferase [Patescibacteria group bacterium]